MTVYVDAIREWYMGNSPKQAQRHGNQWCHMWTDGDYIQLHEMAEKIGLKRSWFQLDSKAYGTIYHLPHYDLVPSKRRLALQYGAVEREATELFAQRKQQKNNSKECV